jgi:hypothetical protein
VPLCTLVLDGCYILKFCAKHYFSEPGKQ